MRQSLHTDPLCMFPVISPRLLGGVRAQLRAVSYSSRHQQQSDNGKNGKAANGIGKVNGGSRPVMQSGRGKVSV